MLNTYPGVGAAAAAARAAAGAGAAAGRAPALDMATYYALWPQALGDEAQAPYLLRYYAGAGGGCFAPWCTVERRAAAADGGGVTVIRVDEVRRARALRSS